MFRENHRRDLIERFVIASFEASSFQKYAFVIAIVMLATLLRAGAAFLSERALLFAAFYPAVLLATLFGGIGPGITSSLLSAVAVWSLFMSQGNLASLPDADQTFNILFFAIMAFALIGIAASYRRLIERLQDEDSRRNLLVQEIQHRNRNTLAMAQAIVSLGLREHRIAAGEVNGRLRAIAKSNELELQSKRLTVPLFSLIRSALAVDQRVHILVEGQEDLELRDNQARALSLVLHELATNATKHGALSTSEGRVTVSCNVGTETAVLIWKEEGGPEVQTPEHQGFGSRLIDRISGDLKGSIQRLFLASGLVCTITLTKQSDEPGHSTPRNLRSPL